MWARGVGVALLLGVASTDAQFEFAPGLPAVNCQADVECTACTSQGKVLYVVSGSAFTVTGFCLTPQELVEPFDFPPSSIFPLACTNTTNCLQSRQGGPGYYINEDGVLEQCDFGHYCPLNATTGSYDSKVECGDGEICPAAQTAPIKCEDYFSCDGKKIYAGGGGLALFIIFLVAMGVAVVITKKRSANQMKVSRALSALHAADDVTGKFADVFQNQPEAERNLIVPAFLEFENVGLTLDKAPPGTPPILKDVTGRIPPRSLVALMGPSGCGKTTFMNAILQNTPYGTPTGKISVNGVPGVDLGKQNLVGYVPQDDIVRADLTVFQNLYYNAMVRLPSTTPKADRLKHVQNCIKVLGLEKVQDAIVGSPERRGVSGGQKKRVNIGMELVAMPSFLFMDEPTSGLDGAATVSLARCMGLLRQSGLTIICVIHQPRWAVFEHFTHVLLLGEGGRTVYWGRQSLLVPYLTHLGFTQPEHENPADWMIDVTSGLEGRKDPRTGEVDSNFKCPEDLYTEWATNQGPKSLQPDFDWTKGDPLPAELNLAPLAPRTGAAPLQRIFYLTSRAFRQIGVKDFVFEMLIVTGATFIVPAITLLFTAGLDIPLDYNTFGPIASRFRMNQLYLFLLVISHRQDYGDHLLITKRELNAGMGVVAVWLSNASKLFFFVVLKSFIAALVLFSLETPVLTRFGPFWFAYLLGTWCWAAFAQVVSLYVPNQIFAMLGLIILPAFELLYTGGICQVNGYPDSALASTCPKNNLESGVYFPPFWGGWGTVDLHVFRFLWSNELRLYPAYAANASLVNKTNYWMAIVPDASELDTPDYVAMQAISVVSLLILVAIHHLAILLLLRGQLNFVLEKKRRDQKKCDDGCKRFWGNLGCCKPMTLPEDVAARVTRQASGLGLPFFGKKSAAKHGAGTSLQEVKVTTTASP